MKIDPTYFEKFILKLFQENIHATRVLSLSNYVIYVLHAAMLAIHAIVQAYAKIANIKPKSEVKQVNLLLSNASFDINFVLKP